MNDAMDSLATARQRARHAKQREIAAHQRAARSHEQAADLQARLGHHDRAEQARQYAAAARERITLARAEQARWEAEVKAFDSRAPAATTPRNPPEPAP
jgi:hypothetical protein